MPKLKNVKFDISEKLISIPDIAYNMVPIYDFYFKTNIYISLALMGYNGLFVFLPVQNSLDEKTKSTVTDGISEFQKNISFPREYIYPIIVSADDETAWFVAENDGNDFNEIDNLDSFITYLHNVTSYKTMRKNQIMNEYQDYIEINNDENDENDENREPIQRIDSETLRKIAEQLAVLENNERPIAGIKIDDDGTEWILKQDNTKIGTFNIGNYRQKKIWYKLDTVHENKKTIMITAFAGIFGAHHFIFGQIYRFLFYLLTCGCAGILPAIDIIQMAFGGFYYQVRAYCVDENSGKHKQYKKIREKIFIKSGNKLYALFALVPITIGIPLGATVYTWLFDKLTTLIAVAGSYVYEFINNTIGL